MLNCSQSATNIKNFLDFTSPHLNKNNRLAEFTTEEEKRDARRNLGIPDVPDVDVGLKVSAPSTTGTIKTNLDKLNVGKYPNINFTNKAVVVSQCEDEIEGGKAYNNEINIFIKNAYRTENPDGSISYHDGLLSAEDQYLIDKAQSTEATTEDVDSIIKYLNTTHTWTR